ncbi:uncharacterized protein B4U79_09002 [Dinothrombium tinctorium]|uniref:Death domain-containing protein n=1 Tax=Dinothrombium tinctorium TaxID=1965070 RepID=A0A443RHZ3_9ACAR|nr:uncharacterized protein B4U79_09002 [Dinothrombium tinctorium]
MHSTSKRKREKRDRSERDGLCDKRRTGRTRPETIAAIDRFCNNRPISANESKPKAADQNLVTSDYGSTCSGLSLESLSVDDLTENRLNDNSQFETRDTRSQRILNYQNITVVIPHQNLSGYTRDEFYLHIIEDQNFVPSNKQFVHISKVICIGPHGARFDTNHPALIRLPISLCEYHSHCEIKCLYSDTPVSELPKWEPISPLNYSVRCNFVIIKAFHFSLFTVVLETKFPFVKQLIHSYGSTLKVPNVPGVELAFPRRVVSGEFEASCKVLFDNEPFEFEGEPNSRALASPIIQVGPNGMHFNGSAVIVSLPIPFYHETVQKYGKRKAKLSVWRSAQYENGSLTWERLIDEVSLNFNHPSGEVVISFPVHHFSFFKAVWDILNDSVYSLKLGLTYFYPFIAFSMMCQASMEENKDSRSFALEVILYRADKEAPETSNYPYKVGRSLKPKLVQMGCIVIKLKSELFEANTEAGEDETLTKTEQDFRGREFEKQFVCRYKEGKTIAERGTIGKVIVERKVNAKTNELLFEFNLHKHGCESENTRKDAITDWSLAAIKELADTYRVTECDNWKKLAHQIGFTRNEIETKLSCAVDPFEAVINLYQKRGGTAEEFLQRLHEVSRKISGLDTPEITPPRSRRNTPTSNKSDGSNSTLPKSRKLFTTPPKWRDAEQSESGSTVATESTNISSLSSRKRYAMDKKDPIRKKKRRANGVISKRRRQFSEYSETVSSSESSEDESAINRSSVRKLTDSDMWQISALMNTMNWRALGRTLGLEESVLLNIEHAYKSTGFRECAYQMMLEWKGRRPQQCTYGNLYTALCKEKMNAIAKGISKLNFGQEIAEENDL